MKQLPLIGLPRAEGEPAPLHVGDEAWCFFLTIAGKASKSGERRTLEGVGRVRVLEIGDGNEYTCEVLRSTASCAQVGWKKTIRRHDLYACNDRREHAAFGADIERFYGPEAYKR